VRDDKQIARKEIARPRRDGHRYAARGALNKGLALGIAYMML
jgi:hypothetical protein